MDTERVAAASAAPTSGILWVYRFLENGNAVAVPCEQVDAALADPTGWTWVHVGLADARARSWIAQAPVSDAAREILAASDEHMRIDVFGSEIVGVLPDLHQEFARAGDDMVRLRFVMSERMLITSRRAPVHALEQTRRSMETGRRYRAPIAFLDGVIDQFAFADAVGQRAEAIENELDRRREHAAARGTRRRAAQARSATAATGAHAPPARPALRLVPPRRATSRSRKQESRARDARAHRKARVHRP